MDQIISTVDSLREGFPFVLTLAGNLIAALIIFVVGWLVGKWMQKRIQRSRVGGSHLDATLKPVVASVVFYLVLALTLYAVLIKLGVPPTSLIAVFGGAALAIGLALKDTLSNIASGLMLLFLRPLAVGEFVDLGPSMGTITEIGLFATTLKTPDGIYQYVPNSKVWEGRIQNFGRHKVRRFVLQIGVSYDTNLRDAQRIMLEVLDKADRVQEAPPTPPECYVMAFADSSINFECRVWLPADNWFARASEVRIRIKEALDQSGIEIPFPQRVVTMIRET